MPLFRKRETTKCEICGQRLKLLEWEDLGDLPDDPSSTPFRCKTCNQVFCFHCLDKRKGAAVGASSYEVKLVCPRCGSLDIIYAFRKPLPESPEEIVRRRAKELQAKHGALLEVRCLANDNIGLIYEDGAVLDGKLGGQEMLITCGYAGQGPTQFHAFLIESGFQISLDEVYNRHPPYTLQSKGR